MAMRINEFTVSDIPDKIIQFETGKKALNGNVAENRNQKEILLLDDETKMEIIERNFREIMLALGLDLDDHSLAGTPGRIAKMYVKEIFSGLNPNNEPEISLFENSYNYDRMLVEKDIAVNSYCEHHFVPFIGKAHVAYYSKGKVIGLSKINRIVEFYSKRPQVQERLTVQIAEAMKQALATDDVAVVLEAKHFCVAMRGVRDTGSSALTSHYSGRFLQPDVRDEFLNYLNTSLK